MTQPTTDPVPTTPPDPAPAAPPPQTPPVPTTPPIQPSPGVQQRPSEPATGDDIPYFQEGVPWRSLPLDQQVGYVLTQSRKHEERWKQANERLRQMADYDQLKTDQAKYQELLTQTQTERERDIDAARRQGEQTAMARTNVMLAEAYVRSAAAARGVDEDDVTELLETLDLTKFVNPGTGQVDTAKVYRQVNRLAPASVAAPAVQTPAVPQVPAAQQQPQNPAPGWPQQQAGQWPGQQVPAAPQWPAQQGQPPQQPGTAPAQPGQPGQPDFGQGVFNQTAPSGLEAGKAAARARFAKTTNTNSPAA